MIDGGDNNGDDVDRGDDKDAFRRRLAGCDAVRGEKTGLAGKPWTLWANRGFAGCIMVFPNKKCDIDSIKNSNIDQ